MSVLLAFLVAASPNLIKGIIESDRALARTARLRGLEWTYERTFSGDAQVLTDKVEPAADWLAGLKVEKGDEKFWDVNRAEISTQGQFGYTAGSWTLKNGHKYSDGDYVRVWKKEKKDWKLVFEADTATDLPRVPMGSVSTPAPEKKPKGKSKEKPAPPPSPPPPPSDDVPKELAAVEAKIVIGGDLEAYVTDAYFLRPNQPAQAGFTSDVATDGSKPEEEKFLVDKPQDLACSIGYLASESGRAPFLRVWRRVPAKGWQVTLEFLGKFVRTSS